MRTPQRWSAAVSLLLVIGLVVTGTTAGRHEVAPVEVIAAAPMTTARPVLQELVAEAEVEIEHAVVEEEPTTTIDAEETIRRPETTTTTIPPPPPPPTYTGSDGCSGSQTLRVHLQGSDGEAVTAQVSADFKRNGQKINSAGEPIPNDQYSVTYWLTGQDGAKDLCFDGVPDAEVYFEVYPKEFVDGVFTHRSSKYGSAMWHGVWAGPGQAISITVPRACPEGGNEGDTGTIDVEATVDGETVPIRRLVAWSRAAAKPNRTPGFSVADSSFYGTPEVKRLEQVASDQNYFLQVQTTTDRLMTFEGVPVQSCKDTKVTVSASKKSCSIKVNDGDAKECKLPNKPVG